MSLKNFNNDLNVAITENKTGVAAQLFVNILCTLC